MKDYIGKMLQIGDTVVYVSTGKNGFMTKASVVGFTAKMVKLDDGRTVWHDHLIIYGDAKK